MKKRVRVFYSGNVQGVGFRFTAIRIANILGAKGWVRNLRDGRVELVAEGEEEKLREFLNELKTGPLRYYISDTDIDWQDFKNEFEAFDIKF